MSTKKRSNSALASKLFEHSKNQIISEKNRPQKSLRNLSKTRIKLNIILFSTLFCPFRRPWPQFGLNFFPYQKSSKSLIQQRFSSFSRAEKEGFELRAQPSKNLVKIRSFRASSASLEHICATNSFSHQSKNRLTSLTFFSSADTEFISKALKLIFFQEFNSFFRILPVLTVFTRIYIARNKLPGKMLNRRITLKPSQLADYTIRIELINCLRIICHFVY